MTIITTTTAIANDLFTKTGLTEDSLRIVTLDVMANVSDGVDTAQINLIGQYSANGFQSTDDLMGGTIITYI